MIDPDKVLRPSRRISPAKDPRHYVRIPVNGGFNPAMTWFLRITVAIGLLIAAWCFVGLVFGL